MSFDSRARAIAEIRTAPLFDMVVDLQPRLDFGTGPVGQRVLFHSAGGRFQGPGLQGEVLPGGGDWTLFRPDGVMSLDVRLTLRADDGSLILMTYGGRWVTPDDLKTDMADHQKRYEIDPARYYFRTTPLFETGSATFSWLNDLVAVGVGNLVPGGIAYRVSRIL